VWLELFSDSWHLVSGSLRTYCLTVLLHFICSFLWCNYCGVIYLSNLSCNLVVIHNIENCVVHGTKFMDRRKKMNFSACEAELGMSHIPVMGKFHQSQFSSNLVLNSKDLIWSIATQFARWFSLCMLWFCSQRQTGLSTCKNCWSQSCCFECNTLLTVTYCRTIRW